LGTIVPRPGQGDLKCEQIQDGIKWTITKPEVRRRLTEYPDITFEPGQVVSVTAGGCVNTSSRDHSWRDYVNAADEQWHFERNADRLFHGLIWIPGASIQHRGVQLPTPVGTALVRIAAVADRLSTSKVSKQFVIANPPAGVQPFLRMGYEAVDYRLDGQGGYGTGLAPGRGNRCERGAPFARVTVTIQEGTPTDDLSQAQLPFDTVARYVDSNGLLLSPQWAGNYDVLAQNDHAPTQLAAIDECDNFPYRGPILARRIASTCTQQASFDQPGLVTTCFLEPSLGRLHGHVNWVPTTYIGKLSFVDLSADGDFDWHLSEFLQAERIQRVANFDPAQTGMPIPSYDYHPFAFAVNPILSKDSQDEGSEYRGNLQIEFAGYEVTQHVRSTMPSGLDWKQFRSPLSKTAEKKLVAKLKERTAVVTGLLNLDCVHECHTELHPVYAMLIRLNDECTHPATDVSVDCGVATLGSDDPWLIFVRNFGNEGSCSAGWQHFLDRDQYSVVIPAPVGAVGGMPTIRGDFYANVDGLRWNATLAEGGVLLTFSLRPSDCSRVPDQAAILLHGAIHFDWMHSSALPAPAPAASGPGRQYDGHLDDAFAVLRGDPPRSCPTTQPTTTPAIQLEAQHASARQTTMKRLKRGFSGSSLGGAIRPYFHPTVEVVPTLARINGVYFIGGGLSSELFGTPLGSIETGLAYLFPHSFKGTPSLPVRFQALTWDLGLKVQVSKSQSSYVEAKWAGIAPFPGRGIATSPLARFTDVQGQGMRAGFGIQPFREKHRFSLRASIAYTWLPAISEHWWSLSVGPQFSPRWKIKP
jgi:hypothetical protein